ncbi:OLC1v1016065C2 [Oldenlandia corymbosa var. corymbosa]|uniref:OLC1v1016065C2 n=1 Tax=Oldenlandia corymbosa var. corymbosa TaxID=529605 RepID=A0AAV1E6N4_OLDCO|nr:OLC1v1016065C2 [Oldenlandia corymbosa var. corymbosa]
MMIQFLLVIGLLLSSYVESNLIFPKPNIFILAGQSNMAGRGGVKKGVWDGNVPPECQPNPSILRLSANYIWEEAKEPLHKDIDVAKPAGIGPGMPFANSVLRKDPYIGFIGLVPCAIGGTQISEWERGTQNYNRLIDRTRFAMRSGGFIRAILWYQGESDTNTDVDTISYKKKLEKFFLDVRADLLLPFLPIIQVAIISGINTKDIDIVRQAQLKTRLPNVRCVDPKGLPLKDDYLHLTTPSQVKLGQMLAAAFLKFPNSVSGNAP